MHVKKTLRLPVDPFAMDSPASMASLTQGANILRNGGTVAFPTETVYGLGANALDPVAVEGIFLAKQRPAWDPLIVHITGEAQLGLVAAGIPPQGRPLMETFWPGPLTLLLPRSRHIPAIVTAGRDRVGVRMPHHPVATRLIDLAGLPLAAPSANSFGRTSPTRAEFVLQDLEGRIDAVIDSGETALGLESTVVDVCEDPPVLYRHGMVTLQQIQALCPRIQVFSAASPPGPMASPGLGLKHYSPRARLILLDLLQPTTADFLNYAEPLEASGGTVGIMLPDGVSLKNHARRIIFPWGPLNDPEKLAQRLFAGLRELDANGVSVIVCPLPQDRGLGVAIRDRLVKAAR